MLLNQIDEAAAMKLMKDDRFVAQAKSDGVRCQAHRDGDSVIAFSRTGKELALPVEVTQAALALDLRAFILDGELVDGRLIAFDVLSTGADRRKLPYDGRLELLQSFVPDAIGPLFYTPTAWVEFEKKTMLKSLRSTGAEGMVFKNRKAAYSSDRPSSGGNALKWKWKSTA